MMVVMNSNVFSRADLGVHDGLRFQDGLVLSPVLGVGCEEAVPVLIASHTADSYGVIVAYDVAHRLLRLLFTV